MSLAREQMKEIVVRERAEQGLPPTVEDAGTLLIFAEAIRASVIPAPKRRRTARTLGNTRPHHSSLKSDEQSNGIGGQQ